MDASQKKILVAEDDEIVLVLICALLARYSYAVDPATDAAATEELLARENYDAVLFDLNLPNGGVDFLRQTVQRYPALEKKLIVLTARADDARQLTGLRFAALLRKPVEIYELIETVQRCICGERE